MAYWQTTDIQPITPATSRPIVKAASGLGCGCAGPVAVGSVAPIAVSGIGADAGDAIPAPSLISALVIGSLLGGGFMWVVAKATDQDPKEQVKLGLIFGGAVGAFMAV